MPAAFDLKPKPKSALGRYRLLSPSASVRVSPLCLGTMNFGNAWKDSMGTCDKETTFKILDYFYESGGNFIDTANNYQDEEAEKWIGEWMKKHGNRDELVLATKYTTNYRVGHDNEITANATGNSTKSMHVSLHASLKKLQTDYVDILYVHWWDYSTSIPELMQSLNQLVLSGKVLYLGISDTPAWVVTKANEYARSHGLRPFGVYEGLWSAAKRDMEREIVPMARDEGMALTTWGSLGGGAFKTEEQRRKQKEAKEGRQTEATPDQISVSKALEKVARAKDTRITSVALAYILHKTTHVFPIVGGRSLDHIQSNIEALKLQLSDDDLAAIEAAMPFDVGFPHDFFHGGIPGNLSTPGHPQNAGLLATAATYDYVPLPKTIRVPSDVTKAQPQ